MLWICMVFMELLCEVVLCMKVIEVLVFGSSVLRGLRIKRCVVIVGDGIMGIICNFFVCRVVVSFYKVV